MIVVQMGQMYTDSMFHYSHYIRGPSLIIRVRGSLESGKVSNANL